jgi:hypothetical protein
VKGSCLVLRYQKRLRRGSGFEIFDGSGSQNEGSGGQLKFKTSERREDVEQSAYRECLE